jgi:hypothetical protein
MSDVQNYELVAFNRVEDKILPKTANRQHPDVRFVLRVSHGRIFAEPGYGAVYL